MTKKQVAVMDIGSSKIRVMVLNLISKKHFEIIGVGEEKYAGFSGGEFLEPEKLKDVLKIALSKAGSSASFQIKKLYVGINGEFLINKTKQVETSFLVKRKVKTQDLFDLMDKGNDLKFSNEYTLINCSPISYKLDNGKIVLKPENIRTQVLKAYFSYQYADNTFIRLLNNIFEEIGLMSVDYVCAPLAEFENLLEEVAKKDYALLVDCGYISTQVLIGRGRGLVSLNTFSVGGAHIMSDLAQVIKIDYKEAEILKRKAILSLDETSNDGYEIKYNDEPYEVPANLVGGIIKARIDMICVGINKAIELSGVDYPKYFPVFLTGGGLSLMKGAKEYISSVLERPVEVVSTKVPGFNKPYFSQLVSLGYHVAEKEYESSKSFLAKLIKK